MHFAMLSASIEPALAHWPDLPVEPLVTLPPLATAFSLAASTMAVCAHQVRAQ